MAFSVLSDKDACYCWLQGELVKFRYLALSRQDKGVVIRYLMNEDQQLFPPTGHRLIRQYRKTGTLNRRQRTLAGFAQKYTPEDILLLAAMDERHDTPCGPAVKKLAQAGLWGLW
ncbi:MAG: hypothetical protein ACOY4D_13660 [Pseudomonadota bacterium]